MSEKAPRHNRPLGMSFVTSHCVHVVLLLCGVCAACCGSVAVWCVCAARVNSHRNCLHAHCAQELQEQRMAAIGDPAHKRETLGDKVGGAAGRADFIFLGKD